MAYIYDLTDTWNASGTTFNGIKLNVTDSASASSSKLVTLQTNGTEHFSITKAGVGYVSGNLGIGTASPATKLHLLTASATAVAVRAANSVSYAELQVDSSGNSQLVAPGGVQIFNTNGSERMRISSAGNVGIGAAPLSFTPLYIYRSGSDAGLRAERASGAALDMFATASSAYFGTANSYPLILQTNGSERMRINSSGLVGIGTSSPQVGVHISFADQSTNRIRLQNTGSGGGNFDIIGGIAGASNAGLSFFDVTNSATRMVIDSAGRVLIGTTATVGGTWSNEVKQTSSGVWPWGLNCVDRGLIVRNSSASTGYYAYFEYNGGTNNGSISWSGGTTAYNTTSDARIKDNIVDAPDAGNLIDAIQVRSWDFKADGAHWRYGMVAQELLEVAPEAVNKPEDEEMMMGVDYSKLVPMLIKEVQSLRARVAQLEGN